MIAVMVVVLWYTGWAVWGMYRYNLLDKQSPATSIQWSVQKKSDDAYFLHAKYQFNGPQNAPSEGESALSYPVFWNAWSAEQAIKEYHFKPWVVFYNSRDPRLSALQKNFPIKECVSAIVLWGVFLYFLWLDRYVAKMEG